MSGLTVLKSHHLHKHSQLFDGQFLHLTAITVHFGEHEIVRWSKVGVVAIILMITTLAQSAHTCATPSLLSNNSSRITDRSSDTPCTACLLGQAVSNSALPLFAVAIVEMPLSRHRQPAPAISARHGFVMSVRPPPFA
jgi:hypothetical protein